MLQFKNENKESRATAFMEKNAAHHDGPGGRVAPVPRHLHTLSSKTWYNPASFMLMLNTIPSAQLSFYKSSTISGDK